MGERHDPGLHRIVHSRNGGNPPVGGDDLDEITSCDAPGGKIRRMHEGGIVWGPLAHGAEESAIAVEQVAHAPRRPQMRQRPAVADDTIRQTSSEARRVGKESDCKYSTGG